MRVCPNCNSDNISRIIYGLPSESSETDIVIYGGCCFDEYDPKYACRDCLSRFGGKVVQIMSVDSVRLLVLEVVNRFEVRIDNDNETSQVTFNTDYTAPLTRTLSIEEINTILESSIHFAQRLTVDEYYAADSCKELDWTLLIKSTNGVIRKQGCGAFPPKWDEFETEVKAVLNGSSERAQMEEFMKLDPKDKSYSKDSFMFNEINKDSTDSSGCLSLLFMIVCGGYILFWILAVLFDTFR